MLIRLLLLIFAFHLSPSVVDAADTTLPLISEQNWQRLTNDKPFTYRNLQEAPLKIEPERPNPIETMLSALFRFFASPLGRAFFWLTVFVVMIFVLMKILQTSQWTVFDRKAKKKSKQAGEEENHEEDLGDNWSERLARALQQGNHRLAVRCSFMLLLQTLEHRQMIQFRPDKTNYDYLRELKDNSLRKDFRKLTRFYEFAVYGAYDIRQIAFDDYMHTFEELRTQLVES